MKVFLSYMILLMLFSFQGKAQTLAYKTYEFEKEEQDLTYYRVEYLEKTLLYLSCSIIISFFVNLIPFIFWIKKQKPTSEFMMYQVRGKFSYFSVLAWVDAIEKVLGKPLKKQRILLANYYVISTQKNRPFAMYKRHTENTLYLASFGENKRATAFNRMRIYPQIVFIWSVLILFVPINYAVVRFSMETYSYGVGIFVGFFTGVVPGMFAFTFTKRIANYILNLVGKYWIRINGDAGYLHELMHQFSGVYNGHWNPIEWDDSVKNKISGLDTSKETIEYINFTFFKGGGSKGHW
tara:strand:+ start:479 stop:1360 length:882 start_codon:yes stop_codon:yes gene_type:complete